MCGRAARHNARRAPKFPVRTFIAATRSKSSCALSELTVRRTASCDGSSGGSAGGAGAGGAPGGASGMGMGMGIGIGGGGPSPGPGGIGPCARRKTTLRAHGPRPPT